MPNLWFTVLPNTAHTKVSLEGVNDIDDLKTAIKAKMSPDLDGYAASRLLLKVRKRNETDDQAHNLDDPETMISNILQNYGDSCRVLVFLPPTNNHLSSIINKDAHHSNLDDGKTSHGYEGKPTYAEVLAGRRKPAKILSESESNRDGYMSWDEEKAWLLSIGESAFGKEWVRSFLEDDEDETIFSREKELEIMRNIVNGIETNQNQ